MLWRLVHQVRFLVKLGIILIFMRFGVVYLGENDVCDVIRVFINNGQAELLGWLPLPVQAITLSCDR